MDGNIFAAYYEQGHIPPETVTGSYRLLVDNYAGALPLGEEENDDDEAVPNAPGDEDGSKRRLHTRIERNSILARRAKKWHGYRCQACDRQLDELYGAIARNVIAAHHLVPLLSLNGKRVTLDPKQDLALLCPNCHRVIHKTGRPEDVSPLRALLKETLSNCHRPL